MELLTLLNGPQPFIVDGGMGTMLIDKGLSAGTPPEEWNLLHPQDVLDVHRAYAAAGAQLITSNTFGGNGIRLRNSSRSVQELVAKGAALAKQAASEATHPCFAALDIGPLGALLEPYGDLEEEEALTYFTQAVEAGAASKADCILVETMGDVNEARLAVQAAKRACALPILVTLTFDANGRTFMGQSVADALSVLLPLGVDGIGANCGVGPNKLLPVVQAFRAQTKLPVLISPNAGLPHIENGRAVYDLSPAEFAAQMLSVREAGANALGGCCGTTPEHIRAMSELLTR